MDYDTSRCTISCHANLAPCGHEQAQARQKGLDAGGSVTRQAEKLRQALINVSQISTELQDSLRELLSYCRTRAEDDTVVRNAATRAVYADIADKLTAILDGE